MRDQTKKLAGRLLIITAVCALGGVALWAHAAVEEVILKDIPADPRNLCDILQLIVNIKNLIFMIGAPITVLMIIIGGVLFTSSTGIGLETEGTTTKKITAKRIITGGVIGLVIVICAWLIVGGVITALFGRDVGPAWWTIKDCPTTSSQNFPPILPRT